MKNNKQLIWQYIGLAFQLFASAGIAAFIGWWIDKQLHFSIPIFVWLLPLFVIIAMLIKIIRDTAN